MNDHASREEPIPVHTSQSNTRCLLATLSLNRYQNQRLGKLISPIIRHLYIVVPRMILRESTKEILEEDFIKRSRADDHTPLCGWMRALKNWSIQELCRNYGNTDLSAVKMMTHSIKVKMKHFIAHARSRKTTTPYIFDSTFDERKDTMCLRSDYKIPKYFRNSLRLRHWMTGRQTAGFLWDRGASGTTVHIDSSRPAHGIRLSKDGSDGSYRPDFSKSFVKGKSFLCEVTMKGQCRTFQYSTANSSENMRGKLEYEFIQYPGETIFIPGGWWVLC